MNGFSGYLPEYYPRFQDAMQEQRAEGLQLLGLQGPLLIVVNRAKDGDGRFQEFVTGLPGATLARQTQDVSVYLVSIAAAR